MKNHLIKNKRSIEGHCMGKYIYIFYRMYIGECLILRDNSLVQISRIACRHVTWYFWGFWFVWFACAKNRGSSKQSKEILHCILLWIKKDCKVILSDFSQTPWRQVICKIHTGVTYCICHIFIMRAGEESNSKQQSICFMFATDLF